MCSEGHFERREVDEISDWHVELDSHDVLLANNLPAESYLAMTNRGAFEELRGLLPSDVERNRTHADFCRPVITDGPMLGFVRQRLAARAEELGWTRSADGDLHLVADGEIVRPHVADGVATFAFPAEAKDVRLLSSTFLPAMLGAGSIDPRTLGVMLCDHLTFGDRRIWVGDARLRVGVHQLEDHGGAARRWTNGELFLDRAFWEGLNGQVKLVVSYDPSTLRGWVAPANSASRPRPVARPKLRAVS